METSTRVLLLLAAVLRTAPLWAAEDCQALRERRDQLARQAMQLEIALLHDVRQRLCPQQEAAATEANALVAQPSVDPPLNYEAYIRCRARAEAQLQRSRPVLYRNRLGFPYYTAAGARLAQEADAQRATIDPRCPISSRGWLRLRAEAGAGQTNPAAAASHGLSAISSHAGAERQRCMTWLQRGVSRLSLERHDAAAWRQAVAAPSRFRSPS